MQSRHIPVFLTTVLDHFKLPDRCSVLDATCGLGGHSEALLKTYPLATIVALDADEKNLGEAEQRLHKYAERFTAIHANFRNIPNCLPVGQRSFDLILADLGVSSPHLDDSERGFSFRSGAPLDMRYDRSQGCSASSLLRKGSQSELTKIFQSYGELPKTHRFVRAIIEERNRANMERADELWKVAQKVYGTWAKQMLPQIFQALRIAVNGEIDALAELLTQGPKLLKTGGTMCVISYHSLEDRVVKRVWKKLCTPEKNALTGAVEKPAGFTLYSKRPMVPGTEEIENNPRARSALLRAIIRL